VKTITLDSNVNCPRTLDRNAVMIHSVSMVESAIQAQSIVNVLKNGLVLYASMKLVDFTVLMIGIALVQVYVMLEVDIACVTQEHLAETVDLLLNTANPVVLRLV